MSVQTPLQQQKIVKLKLFLKRIKLDFDRDNSDLLTWLKDRDLKIDRLSQTKDLVSNPIDSVEVKVIQEFNRDQKNAKPLEAKISFEEYESIFKKLTELLNLPSGQLEKQSELYLEQQLSDILGFDIVAQLDNQRLNHTTGIMGSEPHLKRYPNDKLENHENVLEAGIDKSRSAFGWFSNHSEQDDQAKQFEEYYISLQLYYHQDWSENSRKLKAWYKFRKMIIINPFEKIAIVGVVGNINQQNQLKKQFGGSPEIIRQGMIWSPKSLGKVLVMFVDDEKNEVPLGPIYFDKLISK